ncbi:MAG TPA: DUF1302 family protein [Oligoflexus sp.]|uniref:DUF1302 family protein n=1 Tax=Oligoflexus sp. TaxID=1971216 RepID=UPI002D80915A|nr:DUF1302 family protein [Oligoflexus sp.]HET9237595.1 DUF1302 family protein [Oligoflexus sp.]
MNRLMWGGSLVLLIGTAAHALPGVYENRGRSLGIEYAHDLEAGRTQHSQLFYHDKHLWSLSADATATRFHLQYRLIVDGEDSQTYEKPGDRNVEKLIAFVEKPWGDFKWSLGLQEVSWGENLLLPILDVVNPRDVGYLRGFYDAGAKQSSPMLLGEWKSGVLDAQLIAVPWAVKSRQPEAIGDYKIADERRYEAGADSEYGGRLGIFLEGVDARLYYFRHHPREPSYRFQAFSGETDIIIDEEMVTTSGMSLSYAAAAWLLRTDLAWHQNFPATSVAAEVERTDLMQSIVGLNYTSDDGLQTLGVELHNDLWKTLPEAYSKGPWTEVERDQTLLTWIAVTANLSFFQTLIEPQIFYLQGLDNEDRMLRLILSSHVNDSTSIGSEYQKTEAATTSPKLLLNNKETLALRVTYAF